MRFLLSLILALNVLNVSPKTSYADDLSPSTHKVKVTAKKLKDGRFFIHKEEINHGANTHPNNAHVEAAFKPADEVLNNEKLNDELKHTKGTSHIVTYQETKGEDGNPIIKPIKVEHSQNNSQNKEVETLFSLSGLLGGGTKPMTNGKCPMGYSPQGTPMGCSVISIGIDPCRMPITSIGQKNPNCKATPISTTTCVKTNFAICG
jgi:hypothetical protein